MASSRIPLCRVATKRRPMISRVPIDIVGKHGELIAAEPRQQTTGRAAVESARQRLQDTAPNRWPWRSLTRSKSLRSIRKKACVRPSEGDEAVTAVNLLSIARRFGAPSTSLCNASAGAHAVDLRNNTRDDARPLLTQSANDECEDGARRIVRNIASASEISRQARRARIQTKKDRTVERVAQRRA